MVHTNSVVTPFGVQLSKVLRVPHIQNIREFGELDFDMKFNFLDRFTARVLNRSKEIICISNVVREYYAKKIGNVNLVIIYNGIEVSKKTKSYRSYI